MMSDSELSIDRVTSDLIACVRKMSDEELGKFFRSAWEQNADLIAELRSLRAECEAAREKRIYKCQHGVTGWCKDCASIVLD